MKVRRGARSDAARAFEIWRAAADATHRFLTAAHRGEIDDIIAVWLPAVDLWIVDDPAGNAVGFLVMDGNLIDLLFVDPSVHGQGYGTALLQQALRLAPQAVVDASEQADNALPFYEARGFVRAGRSETDLSGRPYPLIHLRYAGK